jgi:mannose-6-phosphate isomerase-like protein (cupin superfamily)
MSHPDPDAAPDLTPIRLGEVWENAFTGERATIRELPFTNPEGRASAELLALFGARLPGEHRHPGIEERLTVVGGELTVKIGGETNTLREAETAVIEPNVWHDFWNASDYPARVLVQVTPGERFAHMIETLFGLARLGHTNDKGMPNPLRLAVIADAHFDDVRLPFPPAWMQKAGLAMGAPLGRLRVSPDVPAALHRCSPRAGGYVRS